MNFLKRIDHINIIIPRGEENEARDFYCKFLGFVELEKPPDLKQNGGLWLKLGDVQIHLSIQDGYDPSTTKAHIAYEVNDLTHLRNAFIERGSETSDAPPIPGVERFFVRDPFGNSMEFLKTVEV